MRIISDFHDYYDCIQRLGQDQTLVYLRKQATVDGHPFPVCQGDHGSWKHPLTKSRIIGFCGTIIPMLELYSDSNVKPRRCWSIEDVDQSMKDNLNKSQLRAYNTTRWTRGFNYTCRRAFFEEFFVVCNRRRNNYEHLFRLHRTPVFVTSPKKLVVNASLKSVEFFTQMDTYRTFQEIAMYMGGVLGSHGDHKTKYKGELISSEVSDRDLIIAKGFDRHSFRSSK